MGQKQECRPNILIQQHKRNLAFFFFIVQSFVIFLSNKNLHFVLILQWRPMAAMEELRWLQIKEKSYMKRSESGKGSRRSGDEIFYPKHIFQKEPNLLCQLLFLAGGTSLHRGCCLVRIMMQFHNWQQRYYYYFLIDAYVGLSFQPVGSLGSVKIDQFVPGQTGSHASSIQ